MANYEVDLQQLEHAITRMWNERDGLSGDMATLRRHFDAVEDAWVSPSGAHFTTLRTEFETHAAAAVNLLGEAAGRMQVSYNNYRGTESANRANLT